MVSVVRISLFKLKPEKYCNSNLLLVLWLQRRGRRDEGEEGVGRDHDDEEDSDSDDELMESAGEDEDDDQVGQRAMWC